MLFIFIKIKTNTRLEELNQILHGLMTNDKSIITKYDF
jgi:hypothetical protein